MLVNSCALSKRNLSVPLFAFPLSSPFVSFPSFFPSGVLRDEEPPLSIHASKARPRFKKGSLKGLMLIVMTQQRLEVCRILGIIKLKFEFRRARKGLLTGLSRICFFLLAYVNSFSARFFSDLRFVTFFGRKGRKKSARLIDACRINSICIENGQSANTNDMCESLASN